MVSVALARAEGAISKWSVGANQSGRRRGQRVQFRKKPTKLHWRTGKSMVQTVRRLMSFCTHLLITSCCSDFRFKVIFWKSPPGETYFSVNDGPLRTGADPSDEAF